MLRFFIDVDSEDGNVSDVDLFCEPKFKARRKERVQFFSFRIKVNYSKLPSINHWSSVPKYHKKDV